MTLLPKKMWPAAAVLLLTLRSQAATLSDNLSAPTYYTELVSGASFIAAGFRTNNTNYSLTSVTLLMRQDAQGAAALSLYSNSTQARPDDLGSQPGSFVGSLSSPGNYPTAISPVTFDGNNLKLSPETTYWLVMSAVSSGTYEWAYAANNEGSGVGFYPSWGSSNDAGQSWYSSDLQPMQMRITGNPVANAPEPGITSLLLFGVVLIGLESRRRFTR